MLHNSTKTVRNFISKTDIWIYTVQNVVDSQGLGFCCMKMAGEGNQTWNGNKIGDRDSIER